MENSFKRKKKGGGKRERYISSGGEKLIQTIEKDATEGEGADPVRSQGKRSRKILFQSIVWFGRS